MRWMISDIHANIMALRQVVDRVLEKDKSPHFIFLGDYVDRGLHSAQVVSYLIKLKEQHKCDFLMGNHDDVFRYLLGLGTLSPSYITDQSTPKSVLEWFSRYGMLDTLDSYGAKIKKTSEGFYEIPLDHMEFFDGLKMLYTDGECFACHAYYPRHWISPESQNRIANNPIGLEAMLWNRFPEEELSVQPISVSWFIKGYFGHTPVQVYDSTRNSPITSKDGTINLIDTGSFIRGFGRLCAMCHDTQEVVYSSITPI